MAVLFVALSFGLAEARAQTGDDMPIHSSADKQFWDRKNNRIELVGNAAVRQPGELLTADYIVVDMKGRTLDAKGNCVYIARESIIHGEQMHLNLDSRTGSIIKGRVSNDRFTLSGERINRLGANRFQTHWGEYSTCRDCPQTWTFVAEDVDMELEGYAFMSNVNVKIKDAPALWLPYLVVPMKTQRQTGLLFPRLGFGGVNGTTFVQPFFWSISRSADMTLGLGYYGKRGRRGEWEGRYALTPRSVGRANFFYTQDKEFRLQDQDAQARPGGRWALDLAQTQELPFGIEQKLKIQEVSDNLYPIQIGDIARNGEPVLASSIIFSYSSPGISSYVSAQRFRNILNVDRDLQKRLVDFDPRTVQVLPTAVVTTNDQFLWHGRYPLAAGLSFGVTNFARSAGAFDYDDTSVPWKSQFGPDPAFVGSLPRYNPGVDPLRKATRITYNPSLYTTLRPFDVVSVVPSAEYRGYFYSFEQPVSGPNPEVPSLNRGYLLTQVDMTTQFERVYDMADPDVPRLKHLIRPKLTYSMIPYSREDDSHPFVRQMNYARSKNLFGYQFDDRDIFPIENNPATARFFVPLSNSISYGVTTQLIQRRAATVSDYPSYLTLLDFSVGQSFNFREYRRPMNGYPQPLSRVFSNLNLNFNNKFTSSTTYFWYPYINTPRNQLSTSLSYIIERGFHQRILSFERSVKASYTYLRNDCTTNSCGTSNFTTSLNYSMNDYLLPSATASYDFINHGFFSATGQLSFQAPSQCWRVDIGVSYIRERPGGGFQWAPSLALNLTGSGFSGVGDVGSGQAK